MTQEQVVADPWVLVPILFRDAYVGGWTAAEHWDLTEQIFTTLLVCTTDRVRHTELVVAGAELRARHISQNWLFGTQVQWRDGSRLLISDPHKTIVDLCADPRLGGGIQHVTHCLRSYLGRSDRDVDRLVEYAKRLRVPAAFKRLGFLSELLHGPAKLVEESRRAVTVGLASLDPVLPCPKVSKRWQLRIPAAWDRLLRDD